ncbi:hypothetical protein OOJ91_33875 [Micromonospora lupini]|uniref:hypothetical protein n=1 Tax=Micromonospora lupini TaxID=285679 RepID=UPI0022555528|nr:hypothetical protein [Micromonospora lupini]MCX5070837.1 hypothetical protein [Micromonospora lupini]
MDLIAWVQDTPSWALLVGVVTPFLVSIVNQPQWSKPVRQTVAVLVAVVLGVLGCLADGTLGDGMTVLQVITVVAVASHAAYKTVLHHVTTPIEEATSRRKDYDLAS